MVSFNMERQINGEEGRGSILGGVDSIKRQWVGMCGDQVAAHGWDNEWVGMCSWCSRMGTPNTPSSFLFKQATCKDTMHSGHTFMKQIKGLNH